MNKIKKKINKYLFSICIFLSFSFKFISSSENLNQNNEDQIKNLVELIEFVTNLRMRGFLTLISFCEGTEIFDFKSYEKICKKYGIFPASLKSYKTLFAYKNFNNFSDHPRIKVKSNNIVSSAAGRYQILTRTFDGFLNSFKPFEITNESIMKNEKIKISIENAFNSISKFYENFSSNFKGIYKKPSDLLTKKFGPFMQDLCAINLIKEHNALNDVIRGNYGSAEKKLTKIWASFPSKNGKSHYENQPARNPKHIKELSKITLNSIREKENPLTQFFEKSKIFLENLYGKFNEKKNENLKIINIKEVIK